MIAMLIACLLLAAQGGVGWVSDCATANQAGSPDCPHCQPHDGATSCLALHGCATPAVFAAAALSLPFHRVTLVNRPPAQSPRVFILSFAPPLRPPAISNAASV